jgi:hypothetical protein
MCHAMPRALSLSPSLLAFVSLYIQRVFRELPAKRPLLALLVQIYELETSTSARIRVEYYEHLINGLPFIGGTFIARYFQLRLFKFGRIHLSSRRASLSLTDLWEYGFCDRQFFILNLDAQDLRTISFISIRRINMLTRCENFCSSMQLFMHYRFSISCWISSAIVRAIFLPEILDLAKFESWTSKLRVRDVAVCNSRQTLRCAIPRAFVTYCICCAFICLCYVVSLRKPFNCHCALRKKKSPPCGEGWVSRPGVVLRAPARLRIRCVAAHNTHLCASGRDYLWPFIPSRDFSSRWPRAMAKRCTSMRQLLSFGFAVRLRCSRWSTRVTAPTSQPSSCHGSLSHGVIARLRARLRAEDVCGTRNITVLAS